MALIKAKTDVVFARDQTGQFLAAIDARSRRVVERGVERGARYSRAMAPAGRRRHQYADRPGYVPLKRSIRTHVSYAGNQGYWYSIAPHALFVEEGTEAHPIEGHLKFWWKGGFFYWNNPRYGPYGSGKPYENWDHANGAWVWHPGTNAQPFLRPAYDKLRFGGMQDILREEFRR